MIKLFSTLSLAGFMFFGWLMADGVVIEDDTPSIIESGKKNLVTVQINKGQVNGFAKLQLEIPEGLSAQAVDTKGASFTFDKQKAKFIWMVLPDNQEFAVSYYLMADDNASGNKVLTGTFSYIRDNSRIDYDLNSKNINVFNDDVAVDTGNQGSNGNQGGAGNTGVNASGGNGLVLDRTISKVNDSEYLVTVAVSDAQLNGFAKLMESVPEGYSAKAETTAGATTTIEPGGIKYVWFSPPSTPEFEVTYKLTKTDAAAKEPAVNGSFAYIENNEPREVAVMGDGDTMDTASENLANNSSTEETTNETIANNATETVTDVTDEIVETVDNEANEVTETAQNTTNTATNEVAETVNNTTNTAAETAENTATETEETAENVVETVTEKTTSTNDTAANNNQNSNNNNTESNTTQNNTGNTSNTGQNETAQNNANENTSTNNTASQNTDNSSASNDNKEVAGRTGRTNNIPEPETGVSYRVQIAAGPNTVGKAYFNQKHKFNENFNIENHNGYVKYTTGGHGVYRQARNDRERIKNQYNFNGPFVTAYNDGDRITVQEALMITQQKWFQ